MSIGTDRVRLSFNPSQTNSVDKIKGQTADLIDFCAEQQRSADTTGEAGRCWALAMTAYEEAAMWAVKAATAPK